ncbi:MAG: ATP-binding protein [marine bacterium B5-7]|nr:MAG: ATP-binding protein [marine bacterium B5-7]
MNEQAHLTRAQLKTIVLDQQADLAALPRGVTREKLPELVTLFQTPQVVIVQGVRRCGKSTLFTQLIDHLRLDPVHYLNFEDERLISFSVSHFAMLQEIFYEINGEGGVYFFDEIQEVDDWERFIRRLHNAGEKVLIAGSNATLLSQELGSKLTGRHVDLILYPFSYREYLAYCQLPTAWHADTKSKSRQLGAFHDFLRDGGMPIYLENKHQSILNNLYEDIISRDILQRYQIDNPKLFKQLSLYLLSNCASMVSAQKLKTAFGLGSVNTIIKYLGYLENCYLFFLLPQFFPALRKQMNAQKKIYSICNAFIDKIGFHVHDHNSVMLENLIFLHLNERFQHVFYYKTQQGLEVDFLAYDQVNDLNLYQISWSIADPKTRERETKALWQAMDELNLKKAWILTESEENVFEQDGKTIQVLPVCQCLLT